MKQETQKKLDEITVKFAKNYNGKLYGKYFTTVRKIDSKIEPGKMYDIELEGKSIMLAKCIKSEVQKFHEIPESFLMLDTGMNVSGYLELFKKFGFDINNFELEVKIFLFEVYSVKGK